VSTGFLFWLLMILTLLFGGWVAYPFGPHVYGFGFNLLLWVLLFLLGWKVFGPPLRNAP